MYLIARQPDLGTSLMLPPVLLALLYVAGAKRWLLIATVLLGIASLPLVYLLRDVLPLLRGYQMLRLTGFFEQSDPRILKEHAYQLYQSLIAIGSGGLTGQGLGCGHQNRLLWLPEKQTDFIYSVVGEEWGFAGVAAVAVLFLVFSVLCLRVAFATREPFGRLVAAGVAVAFASQSVQNMGMTVGLTPIAGVPLPFVSFGGSSLLNSYFSLGLVVGIARRQVRVVASRDLDPQDRPRALPVVSGHGGGLLTGRWPVR
jgi:rod shape determining protein RodA